MCFCVLYSTLLFLVAIAVNLPFSLSFSYVSVLAFVCYVHISLPWGKLHYKQKNTAWSMHSSARCDGKPALLCTCVRPLRESFSSVKIARWIEVSILHTESCCSDSRIAEVAMSIDHATLQLSEETPKSVRSISYALTLS